MKRSTGITLAFYFLSLFSPHLSHANPALAVIPAAAIGLGLLSVASNPETKVAINNSSNYDFDGTTLTAPLVAYNTYMQANVQLALGYFSHVPVDLKYLYDSGYLQTKASLQSLLESIWPSSSSTCSVGDIVDYTSFNIASQGTCVKTSVVSITYTTFSCFSDASAVPSCGSTIYYTWDRISDCPTPTTGSSTWTRTKVIGDATDNPVTWPYGAPTSLTPDQVATLGQALKDAASSSPAVKNDLDSVLKDHPSAIPSVSPISPADIQQYVQSAIKDANQSLIDSLQTLVAANPDNAELAAELAKAQAEAAKDDAEAVEETYSSISPSAFDNAYDPGEFDIPGRFTTFLSNVKSSGLFSFSTSFFNSLPGGGSSTYEIDGGETFGHHTIDLSESLSGGLAVLKTILLAIFGFLSIRAIIMKR